ncbi:hypothetical protein P5G51_016640 [Virgibacillus sp. 179-BFC.A HS]|uniref:Uncharacterized protein n=1 Tax=Tigheibacillus jepli TaxID=3035914 RepID=A0ABU5CLS5_9BACI|nr:hypothetical protein [Virgibacillus sp. 179-BFC.A HS]MDY0406767.1 hypothetical protein [Virgibacillus sp. 179-BFC.A HS]
MLQLNKNKETEMQVSDNHFTAPLKAGKYYYSYSVWWMDEKEENVSNGDAAYRFVLEVQ